MNMIYTVYMLYKRNFTRQTTEKKANVSQ